MLLSTERREGRRGTRGGGLRALRFAWEELSGLGPSWIRTFCHICRKLYVMPLSTISVLFWRRLTLYSNKLPLCILFCKLPVSALCIWLLPWLSSMPHGCTKSLGISYKRNQVLTHPTWVKLENMTEWRKPITKDQMLSDAIYLKYPEQGNS